MSSSSPGASAGAGGAVVARDEPVVTGRNRRSLCSRMRIRSILCGWSCVDSAGGAGGAGVAVISRGAGGALVATGRNLSILCGCPLS